jgi:hypothetical protein
MISRVAISRSIEDKIAAALVEVEINGRFRIGL